MRSRERREMGRMGRSRRWDCRILAIMLLWPAFAQADESWALHGQATFLVQFHPAFRSPFEGAASLSPSANGRETFDATLFGGVRLWPGAEAWANLEADQGFGLSNTLGVAGFPSGEAYKVGKSEPYLRLQRMFLRQTFDLGGDAEQIAAAANQLETARSADNLVITAGKFSVVDIFDANSYSLDPRTDFMNWVVIDSGAFDYAADAWGYTYGLAVEWTRGAWSLRGGLFDLSRVPNGTELERYFDEFELTAELERRYVIGGLAGRVRFLGFVNRGRMGSYNDAVALAISSGQPANVALVRRYRSRPGMALNLEQRLSDMIGAFLRLSLDDGSQETYEFTDIHRGLSIGLTLQGDDWGRKQDSVGIAFANSAISQAARSYFDHGGIGLLIGDGRLPHYADENIVELFYDFAISPQLNLTADYQLIAAPAFNADRGPVSVLGLRMHSAF